MNSSHEVLEILKTTGAILEGHFLLTSGLHSPRYIEKFRILEQPALTEKLCSIIAADFQNKNITAVVGPMTGGIILAYETGRQLGCKAIFTERVNGKMTFKRGFTLNENDRILIVEDIITTGESINEVINITTKYTKNIIGIACLVDRTNNMIKFPYPFKPLLALDVAAYKPEECPFCKKNIPLIKPGSTNK